MESHVEKFSRLSSRSMSFSAREETRGEEEFYTKFPTFEDISMDEQLKTDITLETLKLDIRNCDEMLKNLKLELENLYSSNDYLLAKFKEYNINYINPIFHVLYISRQIEICYFIFEYKYQEQPKDSYETFLLNLNVKYNPEINIDEFYQEHTKSNVVVYKYLSREIVDDTKNELVELFKNECAMRKNEREDYISGIETFDIGIKFINMILAFVFEDIKELKNDIKDEKNIVTFFSDLARIESLAFYCNLLYPFSKDDIFNKKEDSEEWKLIKKHHKRLLIFPRYIVKKQLQKVFDMVNLGYAGVSKGFSEFNSEIMKKASAGFYMMYYFFNRKKALTQSKIFLMKPDTTISQTIWNMMDTKGIKQMVKIAFPSIKYNKKFFLRRIRPELTLQEILQLTEKAKDFSLEEVPLLESNENKLQPINLNSENNFAELIKEKNTESNNKTDNNYIKVRIYHSLDLNFKKPENVNCFFSCCKNDSNNQTRNALIIHIHGGGFIAMSPSSHENYTRKWANGLHVPIISIDYRLAPLNPFPKALDDVFQSYVWIMVHGEEYFRMKFDNIILAGDSAGGNLVVSLAYLLIMKKIRLPTALFIFYPALKMCVDVLSLSYFNSITDQVLEFNLLKFCVEAYKGEYNDTKNPFMSPLYMEDNFLRYLPPVRIFGGTSDPLRDDSIYFMEKLLKLNKDIKMIEFKYFPHGFLNYDIKMMMPEAAVINEMVIKEMEKFIAQK